MMNRNNPTAKSIALYERLSISPIPSGGEVSVWLNAFDHLAVDTYLRYGSPVKLLPSDLQPIFGNDNELLHFHITLHAQTHFPEERSCALNGGVVGDKKCGSLVCLLPHLRNRNRWPHASGFAL